jgi:type I restriction-modification system DNA methylase subunit
MSDATDDAVGYEAQLWQFADALQSNIDATVYMLATLGLLFLKNNSDAFEERHAILQHTHAAQSVSISSCG